ncbi:MAG TPA: deoxyribose-phosphate aldolase, partial [Kiloniellaceae bacterium]|nr:deoxyribose-phosphate aldolase [Kiloniellaceae bacterium]
MLRAIKDFGRDVGFKAAGGIRDTAAAGAYLALADRIMGPDWADPWRFRFGASGLLNDLLAVLGDEAAPAAEQGY